MGVRVTADPRTATACVLSYNRPTFLDECLESLTANPGGSLEVVLHDDGSVFDTAAELPPYVLRRRVSTLILNAPTHNRGRGVAMNRCFAIAAGDPLIVVDQDLVFFDGWLGRVNALMERNPTIGLLSGYRYAHKPCDWRDTLMFEHGEPERWQQHEYVMGSFMAIRRSCWEELGPFEEGSESFAEDHTFQRRVTDSGRWLCATPLEPLCRNQGYGIGPSTVVTADGTVAKIHKEPWTL